MDIIIKKAIYTFSFIGIIMLIYLIVIASKNDLHEVEKEVLSLNQPMTNLVHIELLEKNQAIAFYKWGSDHINFGSAYMNKGIFGWKVVGSSSSQQSDDNKIDWSFSNLEQRLSIYTDLIKGKLHDPLIQEIIIKTVKGNEYAANIVNDNNNNKYWFLVTKGEDLVGSTITGYSSEGKKIEEVIRLPSFLLQLTGT